MLDTIKSNKITQNWDPDAISKPSVIMILENQN